jgi:peptidoglycan hydrolase-like protein with peptidoglycan-binding domain
MEGMRRLTRQRMAAGGLIATAAAILAIVLLSGGHSKGSVPPATVPSGETTATVTRRTLTESAIVDGTLGYGRTLELYDRLSGTFTWLPSVGSTIRRGGTVFRVDDLPVVLMYGSVPAYRALKEGVSDGPDVAELNRNLIDLGYDPYGAITEDSRFGEATAAAVRRWQKAEGLPETGEVELGRVVFAPGARRVTAVHVALGQDPPGGEGSAPGESSGQPPSGGESPEQPAPSTGTPSGEPTSAPGEEPSSTQPEGESSSPRSSKPSGGENGHHGKHSGKTPAHGSHSKKPSGESSANEGPSAEGGGKEPSGTQGGAGAGTAVLTTTSTQQLVRIDLTAEQQRLAHIGERAPVTLPGGRIVQGRITEVGTVASEATGGEEGPGGRGGGSPGEEGNGESATVPVTLALAHRVRRLDQAPVSVELVESIRRNVLAVPATALVAIAGGGYAIEALEGGRRVQLPVTPGMFADGYVQVQGSGLHEGQTVIEAE